MFKKHCNTTITTSILQKKKKQKPEAQRQEMTPKIMKTLRDDREQDSNSSSMTLNSVIFLKVKPFFIFQHEILDSWTLSFIHSFFPLSSQETGVPWWPRGQGSRIYHCHWCDKGLIPSLGTSTCHGYIQKKRKKYLFNIYMLHTVLFSKKQKAYTLPALGSRECILQSGIKINL